MYGRFQAENFFVTTVTHNCTLNPYEDGVVDVQDLPAHIEEGKLFYVVFKLDDESRRFTLPMYVEGGQLKYHGYDVHDNHELLRYDTVCMNDLAENLNYLFDNVDDIGTVHRKGGLDILVYGGKVTNGKGSYIVEDTDITLEDNTTNHLVLDSNDCTIKVVSEVADFGQYLFADIETFGGEIIGIELAKAFFVGDNFSAEVFKRNEDGVIMINYDQDFSHASPDLAPSTEAVKEYVDGKTVVKSDEAPEHPSAGDQWYNTNENKLYIYNGAQWQEVGSGGGGGTSLLGGWNAETGLPTSLQTGYNYKNGDTFLVDNVNKTSYRKEEFGNYHIPTNQDLNKLKIILNTMFHYSDYDDNVYNYMIDIRNSLKLPVSDVLFDGINFRGLPNGEDISVMGLGVMMQSADVAIKGYPGTDMSYVFSDGLLINPVNPTVVLSSELSILEADGVDIIYFSQKSAYPIRLFADTPVIPDENWTTLKSVGLGGSFWNNDLGLISISADGTDWITLKDKNEGATEVMPVIPFITDIQASLKNILYDIAKGAGDYYQWGNNYGFEKYGLFMTANRQESPTSLDWGIMAIAAPFNYGNFAHWLTNPALISGMGDDVLSSSDWARIKSILINLGITNKNDISRYLKLPLAGFINGTDGTYQDNWDVIGGFYYCSDWDDQNYATKEVLINYHQGADTITIENAPYSTEGYNLRSKRIYGGDFRGNLTDVVTLFDGSSYAPGAGIFHSPGACTIKITDGNDVIYIKDRNEGATEVYNYGDELTLDNIGAYYQYGKIVGYYPIVGTSGRQYRTGFNCSTSMVDTAGLSPYSYNSDTFIYVDMSDIDMDSPTAVDLLFYWQIATNVNLWKYDNKEYYGTNYKPYGLSYNGNPSTVLETQAIDKGNQYTFLNGEWVLNRAVVNFEDISGEARDNLSLNEEFSRINGEISRIEIEELQVNDIINGLCNNRGMTCHFEPIAENYADVQFLVYGNKAIFNAITGDGIETNGSNYALIGDRDTGFGFIIYTTVTIETNTETGDEEVVVGEVTTSVSPNDFLDNYVCPNIRDMFYDLGVETVKKLIGDGENPNPDILQSDMIFIKSLVDYVDNLKAKLDYEPVEATVDTGTIVINDLVTTLTNPGTDITIDAGTDLKVGMTYTLICDGTSANNTFGSNVYDWNSLQPGASAWNMNAVVTFVAISDHELVVTNYAGNGI